MQAVIRAVESGDMPREGMLEAYRYNLGLARGAAAKKKVPLAKRLYRDTAQLAAMAAPYFHQRLKAVEHSIRPLLDATNLTDDELAEFLRLAAKCHPSHPALARLPGLGLGYGDDSGGRVAEAQH